MQYNLMPGDTLTVSGLTITVTNRVSVEVTALMDGFTLKVSNPPVVNEEVRKQIEDAKLSPHAAIVGYRSWKVNVRPVFRTIRNEFIGVASYRGDAWKPYSIFYADAVPTKMNTNGVYAARSYNHLQSMGYSIAASYQDEPLYISGEVYLWGKIIHGERGYRAQYAYPKSFLGNTRTVELLNANFGLTSESGSGESKLA